MELLGRIFVQLAVRLGLGFLIRSPSAEADDDLAASGWLKPWGIPAILSALALPLVLWAVSLGFTLAQDEVTLGDANCDGEVEVVDATLLLQLEAGLLPELACEEHADADDDGEFTAEDITIVLEHEGGIVDELPDPDADTTAEVIQGIVFTILVLDGIFIIVPASFAIMRYKLGWASLGLRSFDAEKLRVSVIGAAAAYVWVIAYGLLVLLIFGDDAVPEQDVEGLFQDRAILPLVAVATVLVVPFAEEIFFRGFVFPGLLRPLGLVGALAVSGLIFAMFHVTGPESAGLVIPFTPIGMLFAWLYYKTGTIWTSITAHFVFNSISFILLASTSSIAL